MRIILSIVLGAFLLSGQVVAGEQQDAGKDGMSKREKLSYSLGYETGKRMNKESVDIDPDIYTKAFREGFAGDKAVIADQEMDDTLREFQKGMKAKLSEKKQSPSEKNRLLAEKNRKEGEAFLAENAKKEGVVTLPSGLQYKVIKEGNGKTPQMSEKVEVHYRGLLINGGQFETTHKRGKPATFGVDKVIKGWSEALLLMKEGSKWMLFIPSDLAYGPRGAARGKIGPNQTLVFEVELISIQ